VKEWFLGEVHGHSHLEEKKDKRVVQSQWLGGMHQLHSKIFTKPSKTFYF
jgi:hypothetical protein